MRKCGKSQELFYSKVLIDFIFHCDYLSIVCHVSAYALKERDRRNSTKKLKKSRNSIFKYSMELWLHLISNLGKFDV